MQTFRTFVAADIPQPICRTLGKLIAQHQFDGDGVKWVPIDILQLTLKFLGEVDNVDSAAVCDAAADAAAEFGPFELNLTTTSVLPSRERPRSLVVAIDDASNQLASLVQRLEDVYAEMGFRREPRDYVPHLAVGRTRGGSRRLSADVVQQWIDEPKTDLGTLTVDRINVIASFLDKAGPTYNCLESIPLTGQTD